MRTIHVLLFSLAVLAALHLGACATTGTSSSFDQLPDQSRSTFDRCWEHIRVPTCGASTDLAATLNCSRASSATYAAYSTEAEKNQWLASHGCPPSVIAGRSP